VNTKEFIVGHHSDIRQDGKPQLSRIDNGHRARGFPKSSLGYFVGYHFVIEVDGSYVQTRSLDERGAHADNCGCAADVSGVPKGLINFRSIGICMAGALQHDELTKAQIETLHAIVWKIQQVHGSRFLLHREVKPTSCPVVDLRVLIDEEHLNYLRKDLARKRNALRFVGGERRSMLERAIVRIAKLIGETV